MKISDRASARDAHVKIVPGRPDQPNVSATDRDTARRMGFFRYLWTGPNKVYLLAGVLLPLLLMAVFKYYYPMPAMLGDSNGYILAAAEDKHVYYRPFGYARFLQLVHDLATGHTALVYIQLLLLVFSGLFCFFSVDYLFGFRSGRIKAASWALLTINPLVVVQANYLLSDALFVSLTVAWFTFMLWVLKTKKAWPLIAQLIVLYWVFQVRYNALYYPAVLAVVLLLSPGIKLYYKLAGTAASLLIIFALYTGIKNETTKATGAEVFAGFSGWQLANNALYMYPHIDVKAEDFEDQEQKILDKFVKRFVDSISPVAVARIREGSHIGSDFLWDKKSPLKQYVYYLSNRYRISYYNVWYRVAPLYNDYAVRLIRDHPAAYFRYFILNNTRLFFLPAVESDGKYDELALPPTTQKWLGIKDDKATARSATLQPAILAPYPALHALLFVFALVMPLLFLFKKRRQLGRWHPAFVMPVLFWCLFLLAGMAFSIMSAIVCLRYETALFLLGFIMPLYFLDRFIAAEPSESGNS